MGIHFFFFFSTSNNFQIMSLIFFRVLKGNVPRNLFWLIVSVSKEFGGSEFTILPSEFKSFKNLIDSVNIIDVSFWKYFERVSVKQFFVLLSC